jgi:perosamine synthetase
MFKAIPPAGTQIKFKEIVSSLSSFFSKDQATEEFRQRLCKYFDVRDCFLVSSGRAAIVLILKVLRKIKNKEEVIVPGYTCFSVPSAIAKAGLKMSLCDIALDTLDLDSGKLPELINKNTLAVLPVYHFGLSHSILDIINLCKDKDIFVIEDCAQGMGAKFGERFLGTFGDLSFFSLGRGKNITTMEGGIILSRDEEASFLLNQELLNFKKNNGIEFFMKMLLYKTFLNPHFFWIPKKIPALELGESKFSLEFDLSYLSEYQAKLGSYLLQRLEEINQIRVRNALYLISALRDLEKISIPVSPPRAYSTYLRLPILFKDDAEREKTFHSLRRKNLGVSKMYPTSLEKIPGIKNHLVPNISALPNSHRLEKLLLTLPTHQGVRERDLKLICEEVRL